MTTKILRAGNEPKKDYRGSRANPPKREKKQYGGGLEALGLEYREGQQKAYTHPGMMAVIRAPGLAPEAKILYVHLCNLAYGGDPRSKYYGTCQVSSGNCASVLFGSDSGSRRVRIPAFIEALKNCGLLEILPGPGGEVSELGPGHKIRAKITPYFCLFPLGKCPKVGHLNGEMSENRAEMSHFRTFKCPDVFSQSTTTKSTNCEAKKAVFSGHNIIIPIIPNLKKSHPLPPPLSGAEPGDGDGDGDEKIKGMNERQPTTERPKMPGTITPADYPKEPAEVIEYARRVGIALPEFGAGKCAEDFICYNSERGWRCSDGTQIRRWGSLLSGWIARWMKTNPQSKGLAGYATHEPPKPLELTPEEREEAERKRAEYEKSLVSGDEAVRILLGTTGGEEPAQAGKAEPAQAEAVSMVTSQPAEDETERAQRVEEQRRESKRKLAEYLTQHRERP